MSATSGFNAIFGPQYDEIQAGLKRVFWDHEAKLAEANAAYEAARADGLEDDLDGMYLDEDRKMILDYLAESENPECVGLALWLLEDDEED